MDTSDEFMCPDGSDADKIDEPFRDGDNLAACWKYVTASIFSASEHGK